MSIVTSFFLRIVRCHQIKKRHHIWLLLVKVFSELKKVLSKKWRNSPWDVFNWWGGECSADPTIRPIVECISSLCELFIPSHLYSFPADLPVPPLPLSLHIFHLAAQVTFLKGKSNRVTPTNLQRLPMAYTKMVKYLPWSTPSVSFSKLTLSYFMLARQMPSVLK